MRIARERIYSGPSLLAPVRAIELALAPVAPGAPVAGPIAGTVRDMIAPHVPLLAQAIDGARPGPSGPASLPELIAATAVALQIEREYRVGFWRVAPAANADGMVSAVFQYGDSLVGSLAGQAAVILAGLALVKATGAPSPYGYSELGAVREAFERGMKQHDYYIVKRQMIAQAERRGIPWFRLTTQLKIAQFGQGHKYRRFRSFTSDRTAEMAIVMSTNKQLTAELLRANGLPVPNQHLVNDAETAVAAARQLGYPVVVKPVAQDMGLGVAIDLADDNAVRQAFAAARQHGGVLVEQQIRGEDYRLTVVQGRMVAAASNIPAFVIGDGASPIRRLIEIVNREPRRSEGPSPIVKPIAIDADLAGYIGRQGLTVDSVPERGRRVQLRRWWRQTNDHVSDDVTAVVHPANRAAVERATRVMGLDLAGVDFITTDITRPYYETGGMINEVNALPGLRGHMRAGSPDIVSLVLAGYFPEGDDGRIPTVLVSGAAPVAGICRMTASILARHGHRVGLATGEELRFGEDVPTPGRFATVAGAHALLRDSATTAAVFEAATDSLIGEGLALDRTTVSAIMGVPPGPGAGDALTLAGSVASGLVVLNADDAACVALAGRLGGRRLCWIAGDAAAGPLAAHIASGGLAACIEHGADGASIVLHEGGQRHVIVEHLPPATDRLLDMAAATGIAHGLAVPLGRIGEVLRAAAGRG